MAMETTGKLHTIFETKQVSERFTKREFVVELTDNPKYPQTVLFQLTGDRCAQLDGMNVGDSIAIEFSLRGREWRSPSGEVKYFNSLDVWKVTPAGARASGGRGRGGNDYNYDDRGPSRGGGGGGGPRGGDPRDELTIPRDNDYRPAGDANDDIPF